MKSDYLKTLGLSFAIDKNSLSAVNSMANLLAREVGMTFAGTAIKTLVASMQNLAATSELSDAFEGAIDPDGISVTIDNVDDIQNGFKQAFDIMDEAEEKRASILEAAMKERDALLQEKQSEETPMSLGSMFKEGFSEASSSNTIGQIKNVAQTLTSTGLKKLFPIFAKSIGSAVSMGLSAALGKIVEIIGDIKDGVKDNILAMKNAAKSVGSAWKSNWEKYGMSKAQSYGYEKAKEMYGVTDEDFWSGWLDASDATLAKYFRQTWEDNARLFERMNESGALESLNEWDYYKSLRWDQFINNVVENLDGLLNWMSPILNAIRGTAAKQISVNMSDAQRINQILALNGGI